ncbi:BofC C-terminal domain-containing protein [Bacillus rubiinfantis]|uniref:BofC C-terminal domain-containing protein n=1 Tax=Bacillus rubiinfantis TaxID=1499680 RepID=UPI0005AA98CD|nr:BofC C-terminal domain-containing protein [Bacillus rubiinfantis]
MRFSRMVKACYWCTIIFVTLLIFLGISSTSSAALLTNKQAEEPRHITVILERIYLDGEVSQETIEETCWSMENFWAKYDDWELREINESKMVFSRKIDDISPLLKANGFFGMTNEGVLTIFNGKPRSSRIIQSFFQLDMEKLESKKQEELLQGIPIKSKYDYVEVLETFKHYSKE